MFFYETQTGTKMHRHFPAGTVSPVPFDPMFTPLKDTLQDFSPIRTRVSHPHRHNTDTDLLLHRAAGMPADRVTLRGRRTLTSSTTEEQSHLLMGPLCCWETKRGQNTEEQGNRVMGWMV